VALTEVGSAFLPHAQRVLKALQDGRDAVVALHRMELGTLRLGAAPTISTYVLPGLLKKFRDRYPGIELAVRTEFSEEIVQLVLTDQVHLGLERKITHPDVVTVPVYEDEVVLVVGPDHPFAGQARVTIEEVGKRHLIMFNRGSGYYTLVHTALRQAGVLVPTAMELDNMEATKQMVKEGLGISFLPKVAVEQEVARDELRQIAVDGMELPRREIALIYRKGRPLSRGARAFVELLEERYGIVAPPSRGDGLVG
jgi:DNA-binding transcriptional LysR family regulator